MDVGEPDEGSSLFQAFTIPSVGIENRNVNSENVPIKKIDSEEPLSTHHNQKDNKSLETAFVRFKQFSTLPSGFSRYVANDLVGTPLDDIDKFYENKKTFIAVNANKDLYRFSSSKSLWLFSPINIVRRNAIRMLTHPWWATFMIMVILGNCFYSLLMPSENITIPWELFFLSVYIFEFLIKVISRGLLLADFTYFRDVWNFLDFFLIIVAISALCVNPQKVIYGCPILCELRVLKLSSISLNLRRTMKLYWDSLVALRDLLLYIFFFMVLIAVLCIEMYMSMLTQHCVKRQLNPTSDENWLTFTNNQDNFFYEGGFHRVCGNSSLAQNCPANYICLHNDTLTDLNPNYGYTSFDNFYQSLFAVFRIIQRDFWEEIMQYLLATAGLGHIFLFIFLIYFGSFQLCALLWTPIATAYSHLKVEKWENDLLIDIKRIDERTSSKLGNDDSPHTGFFAKFQRCVFNIIYNPFAVLFIILCILLNTLFMALDHHNMAVEMDRILRFGNYFFVLIFVIEAIMKLIALGPISYFKDEWNIFDFIVTFLGAVELYVEDVQGFSVLRAFRLLRPLRLGKIVPAFDLLMRRVRQLFSVIINQTIITCMFIYIFVVSGCRAFGYSYVDNADRFYKGEVPRWNFTDSFHSFMIVFRTLCGEWVETLYDCMLANNTSSVFYFFALALIGSFVIMHLFVALILINDDSTALIGNLPDSVHCQKSKEPLNRKFNLHNFLRDKLLEPNILKMYDANKPIKNDIESQQPVDVTANTITVQCIEDIDKNQSEHKTIVNTDRISSDVKATGGGDTTSSVAPVATVEDDDEEDATINKWSEFRVKALKFNKNKYFQYIVTATISIASISLVKGFSSTLSTTSLAVELTFCIMMIIEFISRIISCGWKSYFTNIWCLIDLFNTIVPTIGLFAVNQTISILKALRPISLVSRCSGLKIIASTFGHQIRALLNTLVICAAFWLIFAIMGVQMFAGKFYHCVDHNHTRLDIDFVPNRQTCIAKNYTWINSAVNFDNVIQAYLSLLQVATFKGWINIIHDAVDSRQIDDQPSRNVNPYMFIYFVLFIVFGVFICGNLVIGILLKQIQHVGSLAVALNSSAGQKKRSGQEHRQNENELQSNDAANPERILSKLESFVRTKYFEWVALGFNLCYIILLSSNHVNRSQQVTYICQCIDLATALLFLIETYMRLRSSRKTFLLEFWNFYDSFTAILLVIEIMLLEFGRMSFFTVSQLRAIRIIRFNFLLVNQSSKLSMGLESLKRSKSVAIKLFFFLTLISYVYALIGVVAFGRIEKIFPINDQISFHTVWQSLVLLYQISTTAGWDGVYVALVSELMSSTFIIAIYLISYIAISILITVNLVITIILNYYTLTSEVEDEKRKLPTSDLDDFNENWKNFAKSEKPLFIESSHLHDFIDRLNVKSSLRAGLSVNEESIKLLGIPIHNDQQYYRGEVLIALNALRLKRLYN